MFQQLYHFILKLILLLTVNNIPNSTMDYFTVTLVRHGETDYNAQHLVQGSTDVGLNEKGIKQAGLVGAHLANEKFTRAYSSDLSRAAQTCRIILEKSNNQPTPEIKLDKNLREKDFGTWEGATYAQWSQAAKEEGISLLHFPNSGGAESFESAQTRMLTFMEELFKIGDESSSRENVLVVSHGMQILIFLMHLNSNQTKYNLENFDVIKLLKGSSPNTGKTIVRAYKEDQITGVRRLEFLSLIDGSHLNLE